MNTKIQQNRQENESQSNNFQIVLLNLEEPFGDEMTRKSEDLTTLSRIFLAIDAFKEFHEITHFTRMGLYRLYRNPPRNIVITFASEGHQKSVLQKAEKLKDFNQWKRISIQIYRSSNSEDLQSLNQHINDVRNQDFENATAIKQKSDIIELKTTSQTAQHEHPKTSANKTFQTSQQFPPSKHQNSENIFPIKPCQPHKLPPSPPPKPQPTEQSMLQTTDEYELPIGILNNENPLYPTLSQVENFCEMPQQNIGNLLQDVNNAEQNGTSAQHKNFVKPVQPVLPILSNPFYQKEENLKKEEKFVKQTYQNQLHRDQNLVHTGTKKTLNILVLGATGVGKSTWINGIANYMTYNTLEDAIGASQPICLIPSQFSLFQNDSSSSDFKSISVKLEATHGKRDDNENFLNEGQSATQGPKTYQFETSKYIINIIDTPGIGDTRGIDQDKENTRKILNAISEFDSLHAICFLFRSSNCRLTTEFKFCISELFLQLHKDAIDNLVFFFTNSRGDFYRPGNTFGLLQQFLAELKAQRGLEISLAPERTFCTDNEAFKMVCAHFNGAKFTENEFQNFCGSWQQSADETHRFIEFVAHQPPHSTSSTLSINKARTIILYLAKPSADISELIETNIKIWKDKEKDLHKTGNNLKELGKKVKTLQTGIKTEPIDFPKTVCTSSTCIEIIRIPNTDIFQKVHTKICHHHCNLRYIEFGRINEPLLQKCTAMGGKQNCQVCKCPWGTHMHIRFHQTKETIEVEDQNIIKLIKEKKNAAMIKEQMIKKCKTTIVELKAEQTKIFKVSAYFGSFLQQHAIIPYNDAFEQYIEQFIYEEEKYVTNGGDRSKLENLKTSLKEYRNEKELINNAPKTTISQTQILPDKIAELKTQLFHLPHTGKTFQNLFYATEEGIQRHNAQIIVRYVPGERPYDGGDSPQFEYHKPANMNSNITKKRSFKN